MTRTLGQQEALKIASLQTENERLQVKVASLEAELRRHRLIEQADSILKSAYENPATAPVRLVPTTLTDYFDKRAHLVTRGQLEMTKIAEMVAYAHNGEIRFVVGDRDPDQNNHDDHHSRANSLIDEYRRNHGM